MKKFLSSILTVIGILPFVAKAQDNISSGLNQIQGSFGGTSQLAKSTSLVQLIQAIINYLLFFSGLIAVIFIVYGGYLYITAGGNEEQAEKGRKALTNAMLGLVIIGLSFVIVTVVVNLVNKQPAFGIFG